MADVTAQAGPGASPAQRVQFWKGSTGSGEHWDVLGAILAPCMRLFFAAAHVELFLLLWFYIYFTFIFTFILH